MTFLDKISPEQDTSNYVPIVPSPEQDTSNYVPIVPFQEFLKIFAH
jgi:hypothetical protein